VPYKTSGEIFKLPGTYLSIGEDKTTLCCHGEWTLWHLIAIKNALIDSEIPTKINKIDGSKITKMDSAGALVLQQFLYTLQQHQHQPLKLMAFEEAQLALLKLVTRPDQQWREIPRIARPNFLARLGLSTINYTVGFLNYLNFIGELTMIFLQLLRHPKRIPWRACVSVIESTGVMALPIIALLSFLIGVVLTYQMGLQLRNYGANIYIVDFLGISILREFAPLITAIIIAGRSGSAFTAQLGTMKIRQEIDALQTMGIAPAELLILPKIAALFFVLPLLTVWASLFGIFGGMVVSNSMLHVSYTDFLDRFYTAVSVKSYITGMIKAPVFGLIIASIGCYQGMQVTGSATSVGERTTISVVQSIFFIIVADALFSILFSTLKI